jgi:Right handed beta helix region
MTMRTGKIRILVAALMAAGLPMALGRADAQVHPVRQVSVNCSIPGQTIAGALRRDRADTALVVHILSNCTENVVITGDDITLTTDGTHLVTITAADPTKSTIAVDGGQRVVIDGVNANGFTVSGGTFGIAVTRGGSLDVRNCQVTGATNTGIIASNAGTLTVDHCSVTGNVTGVAAVNGASASVTNSDVSNNSGNGLVGTRSSFLRIGQDRFGNAVVRPVTAIGNGKPNGGTGIVIADGSSGIIVGGTVDSTKGSNIFVGRASHADIGFGTNGLTGGVQITNATGNGVVVEGGNATIVFSTITGSGIRGIVMSNAASGRIGITNSNGVFGANTISGNKNDGIGIFHSSAAFIGGNTIDSNGIFGVNFGGASAVLVGGNTITNHPGSGVLAGRGAQVLIGDSGFGAPTIVNTISSNGTTLATNGGIFAFDGANMFVADAVISNNTGPGVNVFNGSVVDLRGSTAVTVPAAGATAGAFAGTLATLRLADAASIVSATGDGIQAGNLAAVRITNANMVQGQGGLGVNCFPFAPMTASATTLTGNLANVTGHTGLTDSGSAGCNVFQ